MSTTKSNTRKSSKKAKKLKLNLGCGDKLMKGWVNVDHVPDCNPDIVCNLEQFPWPWETDSVEEILLSHVLEHLGESRDVYLGIIKEMYRVCCHGAKIHIMVPHPRHDHFFWDPTHVRPILVESLQMFYQSLNKQWIANKWANTPLGVYMGVDFRIASYQYVLDPLFHGKLERGEITMQQIPELVKTMNNVCQQINIEWEVHKENSTTDMPEASSQPSWPAMPQLPVAWGEVFDKLTILQIKAEKLQDAAKLTNVIKERKEIEKVVGDLARFPAGLPELVQALKDINAQLWDVEDGKRDCERRQCFDDSFVQLARKVYFGNDQRAVIKRQINELLGSALVEEKSYQAY